MKPEFFKLNFLGAYFRHQSMRSSYSLQGRSTRKYISILASKILKNLYELVYYYIISNIVANQNT